TLSLHVALPIYEEKMKALMALYKKAYLVVAVVIAVLSIPLIPFLYTLTKGQDGGQNLTIIYLLYVANTVVTYLYAYKRSIIIADQNMHIVTLYQYVLRSEEHTSELQSRFDLVCRLLLKISNRLQAANKLIKR